MNLNKKGKIYLAIIIIGIIVIFTEIVILYKKANYNRNTNYGFMKLSEIESFNKQFEEYKGSVTGVQISSLIKIIITNAHNNKDDICKVPDIIIKINIWNSKYEGTFPQYGDKYSYDGTNINDYINKLQIVKKCIDANAEYDVAFSFNDVTGRITEIIIKNNQ